MNFSMSWWRATEKFLYPLVAAHSAILSTYCLDKLKEKQTRERIGFLGKKSEAYEQEINSLKEEKNDLSITAIWI